LKPDIDKNIPKEIDVIEMYLCLSMKPDSVTNRRGLIATSDENRKIFFRDVFIDE